jgi:hypothetical protein
MDALIASMSDKFVRFDRYIDDHWDDLDVRQLVRLLSVHSQCAVRLGNMLFNRQRARRDDPDRELQRVIDHALDLAGRELGLEL